MAEYSMQHTPNIKMNSNRTKKFHLLEYNPRKRPIKIKDIATVSISRKWGLIMFGKRTILALDMKGKFLKLYYDIGQNVIAWKLKDQVELMDIKLGWKPIRITKAGQYHSSIESILANMKLSKDKYNKLEVKKYYEQGLLGEDYYYVEVK